MINSRLKGKRVELQLVTRIKAFGFNARRGQQFKGTPDSPDIITDIPLTVECKGRQQWSIYDWMAKLLMERKAGTLPLLAAKKNHCDFLAITTLDEFLTLAQFVDWEAYEKYKRLEDLRL